MTAPETGERDVAGVVAPPPLIYLGGLGLGFALEAALPGGELPGPVRWIAGAALAAGGLALMGSFLSSFRRARTPAPPWEPTTALVTEGPYRFSRNPGYLGMALLAAGIALLADAPWALLGVAGAAVVIDVGVIRREEPYLERLFGKPYREYRRRVRRWI